MAVFAFSVLKRNTRFPTVTSGLSGAGGIDAGLDALVQDLSAVGRLFPEGRQQDHIVDPVFLYFPDV